MILLLICFERERPPLIEPCCGALTCDQDDLHAAKKLLLADGAGGAGRADGTDWWRPLKTLFLYNIEENIGKVLCSLTKMSEGTPGRRGMLVECRRALAGAVRGAFDESSEVYDLLDERDRSHTIGSE